MQTQYQLLYRYINETTNTAITDEADYVETKVFYNPNHKLNFTPAQLKDMCTASSRNGNKPVVTVYSFNNPSTTFTDDPTKEYCTSLNVEAENEREQIIISEMANINKSNNFYVYNGTTKEYHQKFVPETVGYLVSNIKGIPESQMPSGPNDYSKDFIMLNGTQPGIDDAILVCKSDRITSYNTSYDSGNGSLGSVSTNTLKENTILSGDKFANLMMFDWYNPQNSGFVPSYGETPATVVDVPSSQIINIDGDDFLVVTSQAYQPGFTTWTTGPSFSLVSHSRFTQSVKTNSIRDYRYLFFNCLGDKIPELESLGTIDQATSCTTQDIMPSMSLSKNGEDIFTAYTNYCAALPMTDWGGGDPKGSANVGGINIPNLYIYYGWKISTLQAAGLDNFICRLSVSRGNITRYVIPEHYEPANKVPYIVKDNYTKVPLSPWILHSVHNSLDSGLEKARKLVSMIGLENVKLIKTVPFDQFIKIK